MTILLTHNITIDDAELTFSYIRSPGPGGQNVNKVASAVQLRFPVATSRAFSPEQRTRILARLASKLTVEGELIIKASRYRTQQLNKADAQHRLQELLNKALHVAKKRKKTRPTAGSVERRLQQKKFHGQRKKLRQFSND